jgi:hypothetical protein
MAAVTGANVEVLGAAAMGAGEAMRTSLHGVDSY